jgi:fermentation-respiration switch protein FrsA (DUF1100 family)
MDFHALGELVKVLVFFIFGVVALYIVLVAVFYTAQRKFLYFPTRSYVPLSAANANPALKEVTVRTTDGIELKSWYAPATSQPFTIVFFHGNADSLYGAAPVADPYIAAGYGFLLTEYRGYSGLAGTPTEAGLYDDARANLNWLLAHGVESRHIILFGQSLGSGVATEMATEFQVGGLMLLAPYLSIPEVARVHYSFFPASYLTLDRFDNKKKIGKIHVPVLIASGAEDEVIPPSQGRELYSLANRPREFRSLPGRGHNDAFDEFVPLSIDWMGQVCGGK